MFNLRVIYYILTNKKRRFDIHYRSLLNGNEGHIGFYGITKRQVKKQFIKEFPNSEIIEINTKI